MWPLWNPVFSVLKPSVACSHPLPRSCPPNLAACGEQCSCPGWEKKHFWAISSSQKAFDRNNKRERESKEEEIFL